MVTNVTVKKIIKQVLNILFFIKHNHLVFLVLVLCLLIFKSILYLTLSLD